MTATNSLTHAIIRYLNYNGFKAWRNGNHAVFSRKRNAFMKNPTTMLGVSDIIGIQKHTGRFIAIEIKIGKDSLSEAQKLFISDVIAFGGIAFVAKNFEDFEQKIKLVLEKN